MRASLRRRGSSRSFFRCCCEFGASSSSVTLLRFGSFSSSSLCAVFAMASPSNVFTVSKAFKPCYHRPPTQATFRPDMKRQIQYLAAAKDASDRTAAANWAVYLETWDTQPAHMNYLRCLLNAACRYQLNKGAEVCDNEAPASATYGRFLRRIAKLWRHVEEKMAGATEDQYVACLNDICSYRLFEDIWSEERRARAKQLADDRGISPTSTNGVSSDEGTPRSSP